MKALPLLRGCFLYKKKLFPQAMDMKIKVYDTEIRTRDEREIQHPEFDTKGVGTR